MTSIVHFQINDSCVTRGCGKQLKMRQSPFSSNLGICARRKDLVKLYWAIPLDMNKSQTS